MTPNPSDRDQLIEEHLGYVRAIAAKVRKSLSPNLDFDELVAYGSKGLVEAADRFDATRGVAFTTFSYYRIRGAIYDGLRQQGWLNRSQYARFSAASNSYLQNIGDREQPASGAPSNPTQAAHELAGALDDLTTVFLTSMCGDGEEPVDDATPDGEEVLEDKETRVEVRQAVQRLPDKERQLMEGYYFKNLSLEQAGKTMGLSKSWSSRLHTRAVRLLSRELGHLA
jgi:RNA polymerase sigma factor FliA